MTEAEQYNINLVNTIIDNCLAEPDYLLLRENLGYVICDGFCNPDPEACGKCALYVQVNRLEEAYEANDANLNEIANELRTALHLFIHKKFGG